MNTKIDKRRRTALKTKHNLRPRSFKHRTAKNILAQHLFIEHNIMHIYNKNDRRETKSILLSSVNSKVWNKIMNNVLGRFA